MPGDQPKSDLRGKVALVTGESRGVGRRIAEELGLLEASVYVTGRAVERGELKTCSLLHSDCESNQVPNEAPVRSSR